MREGAISVGKRAIEKEFMGLSPTPFRNHGQRFSMSTCSLDWVNSWFLEFCQNSL